MASNKTPLKLSQIPTKNKLIIIDNYSPAFNYIVEDDKIYYSKKGNNDYWVDISENDKARENLYRFLNDKYDFRGYDDREKEIYGLIQQGTFDRNTFGKPATKKIVQQKPKLSPKKTTTHTTKKKSSGNNWFVNAILGAAVAENPYAMTSAGWQLDNNGNWKQGNPPQPAKEIFKVKNPGDAGTIWNNIVDGNFRDAIDMVLNGLSRAFDKKFGGKDPISNFKISGTADKTTKYAIRPQSETGDTIRTFKQRISPQQYIIPESLDVNEFTFGYRNRGQYKPIKSEAASITAFRNFKPFGKHDKGYQTYIGIDANGHLKAGNISQFGPGDFLTGTYSNEIASFMKDKNGNIIMSKSNKNPAQNQPAYIAWNNGKLIQKPRGQAINILVRKDDPVGNQYGNVTGGRVLVRVGNELRLLSGSVKDIDAQFEEMKKRNKADHGTFYTLDNGSFNRGLRTFNGQFTSQDLRKYDNLNSEGGNFLYIKNRITPTPKFRSDTIWTPNVRTVNDNSYKTGHGLTNEQKGIVLHHTAFMENDLSRVIKHLTKPNGESAHVVIGFDGTRKVLARPDQVTFHAGQSAWNGRANVNDFMVGIEFQGDTNRKDLTPQQIQSAIEYMTPIIRANNIRLEDIVTHQQIRDLWFDYAKRSGQSTSGVERKPDINEANYRKIIEALLNQVYYKK